MKKHHITFLLLFVIFLLAESCEDCGCRNCGYEYECYATNTTTIFKDGVPVDTFNFYTLQRRIYMNKCISVTDGCLKKGPLCFSKDSVLNFFHTKRDFSLDHRKDYGLIDEHIVIIEAPVLFITPEGYKFLEYYDYDSVIMTYTFDQFMYHSDWEIDELLASGYELQ